MRKMKKKSFLALALTVLLLTVAVSGTIAYLVTKSGPVENTFEYGRVSCAVTESFDKTTKKDVQIKNTGNVDAYIRATYVVNWLDEAGNIVPSVPEGYSYTLNENPDGVWTKGNGGYFYYMTPVAPGASTPGSLLNCTVQHPEKPEYTLSVEILASAIQSSPARAAQEAWGFTPSGN